MIVNNSGYLAIGEVFASSSEMRATDIVVGDCELFASWHGIAFASPWFRTGLRRDGNGGFTSHFER
jgi:hypothetical protein